MARINDRTVVQAVGDRIVIVDDHTGGEQVLTVDEGITFMVMLGYLLACINADRPSQ